MWNGPVRLRWRTLGRKSLGDEREAAIDQQVARVRAQLQKIKAPAKVFAEVTAWEDSFLVLDFRWKLLCLVADSQSGNL